MATRKQRGIRKEKPDADATVPPRIPAEGRASAPSMLQKYLLAAAMIAEAFWVAALVAMAWIE